MNDNTEQHLVDEPQKAQRNGPSCKVRSCPDVPGPSVGMCERHEAALLKFLEGRKVDGKPVPDWKLRTLVGVFLQRASVEEFRAQKQAARAASTARAKEARSA